MRIAVLMFVLMLQTTGCFTQAQNQASSAQDASLKKFLQGYLGEPYAAFEQEGPTRYSSALVDLRDDGTKEVIVYVTGRMWCGTGGCVMLVLAPEGASYRVVTKTTVTRLPVRVLTTKSNGWHDISVVARISGVEPLYEARLPFDGKTYPNNPSVPPAQRLAKEVQGKTAIPATAEGEPLYRSEEDLLRKLTQGKPKFVGTETIVPGQSVGSLRIGVRRHDLAVSWQAKPDLTVPHENSCHDTELIWFDNENGSPGVVAYVADDLVYELKSGWDERFKVHGTEGIFSKSLTDLKAMMPDGELRQLTGSAWKSPCGKDELFWVVTSKGIAFGLDYDPRLRSCAGERTVQSITVFRPRSEFQPEGCVNPDQPLVPAN